MKIFILVLFALNIYGSEHIIKMLNKDGADSMVFKPSVLKVSIGDKITFIPESKGHNTKSIFIPEGAQKWKSQTSKKFSVNLNKSGTYIYECTNHKAMGMVGIIQVENSFDEKSIDEFVDKYKDKFIMNKQRLSDYSVKLKKALKSQ